MSSTKKEISTKLREKIAKEIRRSTITIMIFDACSLVLALLWIVSISFAWSLQPGAIGTFMMQFLYMSYVLIVHAFYGELRKTFDTMKRGNQPNTLVMVQTIVYYIGASGVILSAMSMVTILRFTSRVVESDPLYYSAIVLSFLFDIMALLQAGWIIYTVVNFSRSWFNVSLADVAAGKTPRIVLFDETGLADLMEDLERVPSSSSSSSSSARLRLT